MPIWLVLRLLQMVAYELVPGLSTLGGIRVALALVILVPALVLLDARRMSERVFAENVGVSEAAAAAVAAGTALTLEALLRIAAPLLAGFIG